MLPALAWARTVARSGEGITTTTGEQKKRGLRPAFIEVEAPPDDRGSAGPESGIEGVLAGELDAGGVAVLADAAGVVTHHLTTLVHFLGEHTIFGVQELSVATGEDPVDLVVLDPGLELGAQLSTEGQALLLASEVHEVLALVHVSSTTGGQLKDLLFGAGPGDGVLLFGLSGVEQTAGAADVLRELTAQCHGCSGGGVGRPQTVSSGS